MHIKPQLSGYLLQNAHISLFLSPPCIVSLLAAAALLLCICYLIVCIWLLICYELPTGWRRKKPKPNLSQNLMVKELWKMVSIRRSYFQKYTGTIFTHCPVLGFFAPICTVISCLCCGLWCNNSENKWLLLLITWLKVTGRVGLFGSNLHGVENPGLLICAILWQCCSNKVLQ